MQFKRVAVTGHRAGIGKEFYEYFSQLVPTIGFDLVDGYDIEKVPEKIILESLDCDLFINNACVDEKNSQARLLALWHQHHRLDKFFILNTSSIVVRIESDMPLCLDLYARAKKELEQVHQKINLSGDLCKSIIISPGIVDTPRVSRFDPYTLRIYKDLKISDSLITAQDILSLSIKNLDLITDRYFPSFIEVINRKIKI